MPHASSRILNTILLAIALPFLIDGLLLPLTSREPAIPWIVASVTGFLTATHRQRASIRLAIAIAYFPAMFVLFFFGGMVVPFFTFRLHEFP